MSYTDRPLQYITVSFPRRFVLSTSFAGTLRLGSQTHIGSARLSLPSSLRSVNSILTIVHHVHSCEARVHSVYLATGESTRIALRVLSSFGKPRVKW